MNKEMHNLLKTMESANNAMAKAITLAQKLNDKATAVAVAHVGPKTAETQPKAEASALVLRIKDLKTFAGLSPAERPWTWLAARFGFAEPSAAAAIVFSAKAEVLKKVPSLKEKLKSQPKWLAASKVKLAEASYLVEFSRK
jgi:hypothetical protein